MSESICTDRLSWMKSGTAFHAIGWATEKKPDGPTNTRKLQVNAHADEACFRQKRLRLH